MSVSWSAAVWGFQETSAWLRFISTVGSGVIIWASQSKDGASAGRVIGREGWT